MERYIVLLRGVNVGGNNKIAMPRWKEALEARGLQNVLTYINSGNAIFDSALPETAVKAACEEVILNTFGLDITACVLAAGALRDAISHAPDWWNQGADSKHNALFVIPPATACEVCDGVGAAKPDYERVAYYGRVIFWSAPLATFHRTRWSKITQSKELYNAITIRNANTALKLLRLADGGA